MNKQNNKKQTRRHREQADGCQSGRDWGVEKDRSQETGDP